MNEKEYIDKYCKYCANRDKDICKIARDLKNNAKCVNYKEYSSKDKSSLIAEIGRLQGKIEYLEEENTELKNEKYVRKSVIREKIEKISKIKTITDNQKIAIDYAISILQDLLEKEI